jgi:polysaccharide deacetylase 2 family uncharacterized protein YibQ
VSRSSTQKNRVAKSIFLLSLIAACLICLMLLVQNCQQEAAERPGGTISRPAGPEAFPGPSVGSEETDTPLSVIAPLAAYPRICIVIDDVGYSLEKLDPFLKYPGPLTLSVLPHLAFSREASRLIKEAGKELILHLPMEPVGDADPGPGAILTSYDEETIRRLLDESLASVPGAVGVNNHMGSKAMADSRVMEVVMRYFAEHDMFFLDSGTTPDSKAPEWAERLGVPLLERDLFLDNEASEIAEQLQSGITLAEESGSAVLIGHVKNREIVEHMERLDDFWPAAGLTAVTLSGMFLESTGTAP